MSDEHDTQTISLVGLTKTGSFAPTQWDAVDADGTDYYIRYRHGILTVYEGGPGGDLIHRTEYGGPLDGVLSEVELRDLTADLFDWSEVVGDG